MKEDLHLSPRTERVFKIVSLLFIAFSLFFLNSYSEYLEGKDSININEQETLENFSVNSKTYKEQNTPL